MGCAPQLLLMAVMCLAALGCVTSPEAKARLDGVLADAKAAKSQAREAASDAKRLRTEIQALQAAVKAGDLTSLEAVGKAAQLTGLLMSASEKAQNAARRSADAFRRAEAIHKEYGVPWWQIGGQLATALVKSYGGWGAIAGAGFGIWRLVRERRYKDAATEAIGILSEAVEMSGSKSVPKKMVARARNDLIEAVITAKTPEFERNKVGNRASAPPAEVGE